MRTPAKPLKERGAPSIYRDGLHPIGRRELPRVRSKLPYVLILTLAPHPKQAHRPLARQRHLGDRAPATQHQMKVLLSPLWLTSCHYTGKKRSSAFPCLLMCPSHQ